MTKKNLFLGLAACAALLGCDKETRNGSLTLSGSAPVRIVDSDGKAVEFVNGPLKVEFSAGSGGKFTVALEQAAAKAKFSGKAPSSSDWNFTVRGREIGQPVDFSSARSVEVYGPVTKRWGTGGPCGFNGRWETEESWRKANEDWTVAFSDAGNAARLGDFKSRLEGRDYLVDSRNTWCRERPGREPFPRGDRASIERAEKAVARYAGGVKFE